MFLLQPGERGRADSPVIYRVPPVPASLGPPAAEKNLPRPRAGGEFRGRDDGREDVRPECRPAHAGALAVGRGSFCPVHIKQQ
jgi:hypothetical protein